MKRILNHFDADPFVIHYHTSVAAVALNLPFAIFVDGYRILSTSFISTETSPMNSLDLEGYSIPMVLFIISIGAQYISTIMSMFVLNNVSVISHQVSNTMKRLLVIVSSILYFRNPILASNALGIIFALAGFLSYGLTTLKTSNEKVTSAKFDKTFCGLLPNYSSFRQILTNAFPIKFPQSIYSVKPEDIESQSFVNESTGMSFSKSHNRFASRF